MQLTFHVDPLLRQHPLWISSVSVEVGGALLKHSSPGSALQDRQLIGDEPVDILTAWRFARILSASPSLQRPLKQGSHQEGEEKQGDASRHQCNGGNEMVTTRVGARNHITTTNVTPSLSFLYTLRSH